MSRMWTGWGGLLAAGVIGLKPLLLLVVAAQMDEMRRFPVGVNPDS